jgi:ketosteroid isomerase-like protein
MTLEQKVDRALAYEEIRQLAYRYAVAIDSRDLETLASLYADEALFSGKPLSRAEIVQRFSAMLTSSPVTILNVGNHLIDFDDEDHARGTVYARCEGEVGPETWLVQVVVYLDRYVRQGGEWRFLSREHLLFYGADMLTRPIGLPPAGTPENGAGKGSIPQRWPTYQAFYKQFPGAPHY